MTRWWSALLGRFAILREVAGRGDALLFARSFGFALVLPLLLRLSLPRLKALLEPGAAPGVVEPDARERIVASVQAMLRAGAPLIRPGCLTRGVTLYYFLRRAGVDVALCFGMGRGHDTADGFDGHCWLVLAGEPYLEPRDPRPLYTEMYSFSARSGSQPGEGSLTPSRQPR